MTTQNNACNNTKNSTALIRRLSADLPARVTLDAARTVAIREDFEKARKNTLDALKSEAIVSSVIINGMARPAARRCYGVFRIWEATPYILRPPLSAQHSYS